jgi:WD40 repeat protein
MKPSEPESASNDLLRQREVLRRNFVRANGVVAVILFALLALALAAVVASIRAARNQEMAEAASRERQAQLAQSLRAQARALRFSGQAGRRFEALAAISNAVALGPSTELRGEAIACLALADLTTEWRWPQASFVPAFAFDRALERFAFYSDGLRITLLATGTNAPSLQLDLPAALAEAGHRSVGLTFSPSGHYLATRLYGGGAVVWEASSGRLTFCCSTNGEFATGGMPCFTQDERSLVFPEPRWGTNFVRVDLASGTVESLAAPITPARLFVVQPQGRQVAVANQNVLEVWNLETGALEHKREFAQRIAALAWSSDGRALAAGSTDGGVSLWDFQAGNLRQLLGHRATIVKLVFSPDGERLCATGVDGASQLLETGSGQAVLTMEGMALQFSEDGQRLAFYRHGTGLGVWRLSPAVGYQILRERTAGRGEGWKSDLSPDGRWLALIDWDTLRVWDLDSAHPPLSVPLTNPSTLFWHPSEPLLFLVVNGQIETRAVTPASPDASVAVQLGPPKLLGLPNGVYAVMAALSGNARTLALVDAGGVLQIGELHHTNNFVRATQMANPTGPLGSGSGTGTGRLAVSPDGRWVATPDMASAEAPHIFETATGRLVKVLPTTTAAVGFSPDGRWLVTCGLREIVLWSVGNWSPVWRRPRSGVPSFVGGAAFSRDGAVLAVTKSSSTVSLLDRVTGA